MSYRRVGKPGYAQKGVMKQLPSLNNAFRSAWESNIDKALTRIEELRTQGWVVDVEQGTLTSDQADFIASEVKKMGCEVERIPIAEWLGDLAQFVAYKAPVAGAEISITPKPPQKPQAKVPTTNITPEQVTNSFVKEFLGKNQPDPHELQTGFLMDPSRVVAFIRRDAQATTNGLIKAARKFLQTSPFKDINNTTQTQRALSRARNNGKTRIAIVDTDSIYDMDRFIKGLKIIGKGKLRVYAQKDRPAYIVNSQGDIFAIAPVVEADPQQVIKYKEAILTL